MVTVPSPGVSAVERRASPSGPGKNGLFLDHFWTVLGLVLDCRWTVLGLCLDCYWLAFGGVQRFLYRVIY